MIAFVLVTLTVPLIVISCALKRYLRTLCNK